MAIKNVLYVMVLEYALYVVEKEKLPAKFVKAQASKFTKDDF